MRFDDTHSLALLDFPRIRTQAAGYCLSEEGRTLVESSFPLVDAGIVHALKEDVGAIIAHAKECEPPSLSFPEIGPSVRIASKEGGALDIAELYALGLWAQAFGLFVAYLAGAREKPRAVEGPSGRSGRARGFVRAAAAETAAKSDSAESADSGGDEDPDAWAEKRLEGIVDGAPDLGEVVKAVFAVLTRDGEMRDLPPLRKAREGIQRANRDLALLADSYFRDPDLRSALQSGEPTMRDGRTVLAVRANFRGRVKGIVHEVSATGQTVFIEPAALVEKNNELVQLDAQYRAEVAKILREATAEIHARRGILADARKCLAGLDARYARAMHCLRSDFILALDMPSGFRLLKGRHPILGPKAVPIDVDLPEGTRTLIVTGPNTGGKTVTLKTIGLFALMNQFGLGIPAAPETGFQVFDAVWADIGDEQSIDQSLSTFSGHMRVLGRITAKATDRSLVLLDELGAGTDPEEGCAVAMGLLDFFVGRGSLTVVTTHHGILKNYGYTRPSCLNASMDFDAASLSPTYRILMGVPGESRALDIAAQNGLSAEIVESARLYLADERTDVSELIKGLNEKHRELDKIESERKRRLRDAVEDQRRADLAGLRVRRQEIELRRRGVSDLQRLLVESRKTLENLVRELRESGAEPSRTKEVKKFLADLAGAADDQRGVLEEAEESDLSEPLAGYAADDASGARPSGKKGRRSREAAGSGGRGASGEAAAGAAAPAGPLPPLAPGDEVLVGASRRRGILLRSAGKAKWLVETGSLRLTVPERDIARAAPPESGPVPSYQVELAPRDGTGSTRAVFELDLRGFRFAEALEAVEKQIDAASLQGLTLFSIIHGTGEGILGKGIQEFLRTNSAVGDYHFARPEEGGYGKTIVRLK